MKQSDPIKDISGLGFWRKTALYTRLSGPGWIQAAVTLGGGTLVGGLYLGVIGGYEFLWLQPLAMLCGIIMLAALSYITLSKDKFEDRPFELAKKHVSPLLGWGWLIATVIANVVFCAAQFALGADAVQGNLGGDNINPFVITSIFFLISLSLIWLYSGEGKTSRIIDGVIKTLVAIIVMCFLGVVVTLSLNGAIEWKALLSGIVPDFSALFHPVDAYKPYISNAGEFSSFWENYISNSQRNIIIGAFGTAVGINMTFLLPYSLMKKKWNKKHRELFRFDLFLGLFIPFILGASCLIISTASQFHAKKDSIINETAYHGVLDKRLAAEYPNFATLISSKKTELRQGVAQVDKDLSVMLGKRSANDLANALVPFLGKWSQFIFGIGILAMALSTMLVHMMMNGFAISEAFGNPGQQKLFLLGAAIPALSGLFSPFIWAGTVKSALVVPASVIATTLLPIAYLIFILLMNSKKVLGEELPKKRWRLNILMGIATGIAFFAAYWALLGKYQSTNIYEHGFGLFGLVGLTFLSIFGVYSFIKKERI